MEASQTDISPARLIKLLKQQRALYASLRELSQRQRALVCGERPELLLNVLTDRRRLVTQLAAINEQLGPVRQSWAAIYDQLPKETQHQAGTLLEEINGTLQSILRTDQEDGALLSARKDSVARSMSGLGGGNAANAAYALRPQPMAAADLSG